MSKKLIFQTVSRVLILMTILGLFLTCDDSTGPLSSNMGPKVVVEPPTIFNIVPESGSFITGVQKITATTKAYIRVDKVEVYIYEDKDNGQREVKWTDKGIKLTGSLKQKDMEFDLNTNLYNNWDFDTNTTVTQKDGKIKMKFRIFDSTEKPYESVDVIYIIKNRPSVIKMAYPPNSEIADPDKEYSKIQRDTEIRGTVIDQRGIRPGYPQIKIWPESFKSGENAGGYNDGDEPPDDDPRWGWASLFITPSAGSGDDMQKGSPATSTLPAVSAGPGQYLDRSKTRVVNNASFSLHLANYTIEKQPNPVSEGDAPAGEDLDLRYIKYEVDPATGRHIPFETGRIFYFKIRTCDTPLNLQYIPINTGTFLRGYFPPKDFGLPTEDNFRIRGFYATDDDLVPITEQPVKILIFNSDARPSVEINNDDLGPTPDAVKAITDAKPNIYITEANSKKIIGSGDLFRLRLLATFGTDNSQTIEAKLTWRHDASGRNGVLPLGVSGNNYPGDFAGTYYTGTPNTYGDGIGSIFTYLANSGDAGIFTSSSEPYILLFTVKINEDYTEYRYVLYMDGDCPEVSIRSIKGSAEDKASFSAKNVSGGLINGIQSTVNGNIQVVVDRQDDSGIMAYKQNAGMGAEPPRNELNYPMVKWVLEPAGAADAEPASTGTTLANLVNYKSNPSAENLRFFNDIQDTQTTIRASGWVRRPFSLQDNPNASSEDRANHFKINTSYLNNTATPTYYWLYVIAQDQVQNLGFVVQKILVDQSTDKPTIKLPPLLSDKNGEGTVIASETDLDVTVTLDLSKPGNFVFSGNNPRNNVLERDQGIEVNLLDDDGIDMKNGVKIWLTALDPTSDLDPPGQKKVQIDAMAAVKSDITRNKRDISLIISQEIMAKALYGGTETRLKDGMYKIEFELEDDENEKVKIVRGYDGWPDGRDSELDFDTPKSVKADPHNYFFAVYTAQPVVKVTFPDDNAWGSEEPILITGTARSRLKIQGAWITFTPNVVNASPSTPNPASIPLKVENLTLNPSTPEAPNPDEEGYYNYTWNYGGLNGTGVIFQPKNGGANIFSGDLRTYTVEAYDRLGNAGSVKQNVQMDGTPPEVNLSDYNHNRPPEVLLDVNGEPVLESGNPVQVTYLYGKVPFTVSASDANGLYEIENNGVKMSGIKWWILPAAAVEPAWNTDPTTYPIPMPRPVPDPLPPGAPASWQGGGNFRLDQAVNGRYTWVIDTRYLADKEKYKLCIIALDKAGNQSYFEVTVPGTPATPQQTTNVYETFIVDQSRDYPVINPNSLDPLENQVKGKGVTISGTVSDLDLFNVVKRNSYVDIRFPTNTKGVPTSWGEWIPITTIPLTYSARYGGIDPSGALVFKFNPADDAYKVGTTYEYGAKYLNEDGVRYYQIRVRDEKDAPTVDEKNAGAKNYGKNPDTDSALYPPPYQFVEHKSVEIVFPMDKDNPANPNGSGWYSFIVDSTPPVIFFDQWDPTPPIDVHPGYTQSRPTFSTVELLIEALSGWVKEDKLSNMSMSYSTTDSSKNDIFFRKTILSNPEDPPTPGEYKWKLELLTLTNPDNTTTDEKANLKAVFDAAPDGMQIIVFEATDMAPQIGRVSYIFVKDKKGPIIEFNITRSIWHIYPSADLANPDTSMGNSTIPATSVIPGDWPGDFRTITNANGTTNTGGLWGDLVSTYGLKYWASDFALLASDKIRAALESENNRKPSTVTGDAEADNDKNWYKPATIEGKFSDEYSSVRILVPVEKPDPTYFYYRFKDKTGKLLDIPAINIQPTDEIRGLSTFTMGAGSILEDNSIWLRKEIEAPNPGVVQNDKTAEWKIELDKAHGFTGTDGENWVDILAQDSAKNTSGIYNLRFVVDRTAPTLGKNPNESDDPTNPAQITDADEFKVASIKGYSPRPGTDDPDFTTPRPLAEMKRVFSGTGDAGNTVLADAAFTLTGTVSDFNFSGLVVTIGQEGYSGYSVLAQLSVEPTNATTTDPGVLASSPNDKVTNTIPTRVGLSDPAIFNDPAGGIKRLTLSNPTFAEDGTPTWTWTLHVLQKDIAGLREAAGANAADSARRYIRVTASDKANKRVGPVDWFFYLDTKIPELEYTNLEKGVKADASSFENGDLALTGMVSDDTRIKDVRYMIGRWDYAKEEWSWYDGNSWVVPTGPSIPPAPPTSWPSVFTDDKTPTRQALMNWRINQATLTAANTAASAGSKPFPFPDKLFDQEGYYRLDLYITDFSLGNGNPHDTRAAPVGKTVDETFTDKYFDDLQTRSGRAFYVDKKDPDLQWGWVTWDDAKKEWVTDPSDTDDTKNKTYFRNDDNGQVNFNFTVGDGNTIQGWEVKVKDNATGKTLLNEIQYPAKNWVVGTGITNDNPPIPDPGISPTAIINQFKTVKPFMTKNGEADTSPDRLNALDKLTTLPTYTITITVWDGANRSNSISKSFTLDNTPPTFIKQKYQPPSYKYNTPETAPAPELVPDTTPQAYRYYTYDAVTGKLNIRGNADDNSNKIEKISYYVVNRTGASFATGDFPTDPKSLEADPATSKPSRWLSAVDGNSGIPDDISPYIQIDEGTFAFKIMVPQTSLFFSSDAGKYAQITNTGGVTIHGDTPGPNPGKYYDLDYNPATRISALSNTDVPDLTFPDINNIDSPSNPKKIYGGEDVALITIYLRAEDAAGNVEYDLLKYWIWPEGDRPIVTAINSPDSSKIEAERLLNGTIRLSGMAKDNERVKYVWFRVYPSTNGVKTGDYYNLTIPKWDEINWTEAGGTQGVVDGALIGARRSDDPGPSSDTPIGGGWYMANGGNSKEVSWWAYINTNGELDPQGNETKKEFTVEVRAQDVTYDEKNDRWAPYDPIPGADPDDIPYRGFASAMTNVSKVTAWVVAGAPIFENVFVAPGTSIEADTRSLWDTIDNLNIRNRSAYKVTVKHNSGLSSIRWSPTEWNKDLNGGTGGFQANPSADPYNLLDLLALRIPSNTGVPYDKANPYTVYWDGQTYKTGTQSAVFTLMEATPAVSGTPRMAVTVKPGKMFTGITSGLSTTRSYLILKWDPLLGDYGSGVSSVFETPALNNSSYYESDGTPSGKRLKDLKNTVFKTTKTGGNIGSAIILEAELDTVTNIEYFKLDVIVDVRADLLLSDMVGYGPPNANQTRDSVRYPVYLSASEVSKATPLTSKFDSLLPIDNLKPYGTYTLNRRPAGSAATIGGEAGDDGPVNGVARVVLWFSKKGSGTPYTQGKFISWHEQGVGNPGDPGYLAPIAGEMPNYTDNTGPAWWDAIGQPGLAANMGGVIPLGVKKPPIPNKPPVKTGTPPADNGTGGDWAIVIDTNSPSVGKPAWGHTLPMGFADGGSGKYWYVEINSLGIESGPVDLHFVVIDKAGNARYYRERLVIMNNVAVIDRIKLATDIRDNGNLSFPPGNTRTGNHSVNTGTLKDTSRILDVIRDAVPNSGDRDAPVYKNDVKKGISDWVQASALGVNNIVDFNVRNNLFALRVETTNMPGPGKSRNFRLEYVSGATLLANTTPDATTLANSIKAGRVYIINDPGTARWGSIGAEGDGPWQRGYAFIAAINGREDDGTGTIIDKISGLGSVWELNSAYYNPSTGAKTIPTNLALADVPYPLVSNAPDPNALGAEFVYGTNAFTGTGTRIVDYTNDTDQYPPAQGTNPVTEAGNSMFILRVFDGQEDDLFGDFTILRIRVNNNDRTKPFAQLYDINPKTEGQERQNIAANEKARSLAPMFIGEGVNSNRTKGGLWNIAGDLGSVEKPGHIEPRRMESGNYGTMYSTTQTGESEARRHSLSSEQMGGAAIKEEATIQKPWANPQGFFTTDTVSGQVVLRGYAEDNQRVHRVVVRIGTQDITILDFQPHAATGAGNGTPGNSDSSSANYSPPLTGLLRIGTDSATNPTANRVFFTDTIDAYRHRVEWAYVWDTETITGTDVRVISYSRDGAAGTTPKATPTSDEITAAASVGHTNVSDATRPNTTPFNKEFPVGINKYNRISFNIRPYITGFLRNKAQFSHDTRSRQGRYMFYRGETAVVKGFNLGAGTINLQTGATGNVANPENYGITETDANARNRHYRQFTVGTGITTGSGVVTYTATQEAVNTGNDRTKITQTAGPNTGPFTPATSRPQYIQPWNIEYSPGIDGSQLWDDFTQVHIWQSNDTTNNDGGRFPKGNNIEVFDPSMSIDPATGTLWTAHNEGGGGGWNSGSTKIGNNNGQGSLVVAKFVDPIINSDIFVSTRPSGYNNNAGYNFSVWSAYSIIGRSGNTDSWDDYGGVLVSGPQGGWPNLNSGLGNGNGSQNGFLNNNDIAAGSQYFVESTGYNAGTNTEGNTNWPPGNVDLNAPSRNQFKTPHIVTYYGRGTNNGDTGTDVEHIHVSYYDTKDKSLKYRYNRRNGYGAAVSWGTNATANNLHYAWTNIDGGVDDDDRNAFNANNNGNWASMAGGGWYRAPFDTYTPPIAQNGRVVDHSGRSKDAGEYNSIALTRNGYPVIAYYDKANQKLKLAISSATVPIAQTYWKIIQDVIDPVTYKDYWYGTGEYVSIKIDTKGTTDIVHIAAMNAASKNLVYVQGTLTAAGAYTTTKVQVVDSVGSVGRWCSLSLDDNGNPWISYQDESYQGSRDGAKLAYYNERSFYKGSATYRVNEDKDIYGRPINGWEAMHVPTQFRVENARQGMECIPTRNYGGINSKFWIGAVGFLGEGYFRAAFYVK